MNMISWRSVFTVLVCMPFFWLSATRAASASSTANLADTTITQRVTLRVGGLDREYLIYVPAGLAKTSALPVVFAFHGGNGDAKGMAGLTRANAIADREKMIVVYPDGVGKGWNDGRITTVTQAHREKIDDLAFFDAMLADVSRTHLIDAARVYAMGISNGAIFSHYLAGNRANKITAIAAVVGGIADPFHLAFKPESPVSVLVIQGTDDKLVPYGGGRINGGDRRDRGSVISADATLKRWREANTCDSTSTAARLPDRDANDGCTVDATKWEKCKANTEVWFYKVNGGGHTWPGGTLYAPRALIGRVTNDIDTQTIFDFFKRHTKGQVSTK
jgi:polyhydroxybutyrate depolymerase